MSENLKIELTTVEVEAIVKSLRLAGVEDGNAKTLLASFHDQGLVQGARKAFRHLRHLLDSQASRRVAGETDLARESDTNTDVSVLKKSLRESRQENEKYREIVWPIYENIYQATEYVKAGNAEAAINKLESISASLKKVESIGEKVY
ncbi:MAG: hypothetical protein ACYDC8_07220 [Gammaproteobacteria bacterium]